MPPCRRIDSGKADSYLENRRGDSLQVGDDIARNVPRPPLAGRDAAWRGSLEPMANDLDTAIDKFVELHGFSGKEPLCIALAATDHARQRGLPLEADDLLTAIGGRTQGLGKSAIQSVLKRHGIEQVLARESLDTGPDNSQRVRAYIGFLNDLDRPVDLDAVEAHWIARVRAFLAGKPLVVRMDASRGLRHMVRNLLEQAERRQRQSPGTNLVGKVMQHLVGAKLECVLGSGASGYRRVSDADPRAVSGSSSGSRPSAGARIGRPGGLRVGDVAIHVTPTPGEAVIARCRQDLDGDLRPILVTVRDRVPVAEAVAGDAGIGDRVDIFEIEQFIALNLHKIGRFGAERSQLAVQQMVEAYNSMIGQLETDPSLCIEFQQ